MAWQLAAFAGVAAAAALCSAPCAQASTQTQFARPAAVGDVTVTRLDVSAGMPVLEAVVNGRGPMRLGLDTGAMGGVYLFGDGAEAAGLTAVGELEASDPSGGIPRRLNTYGRTRVAIGARVLISDVAGAPTPAPGSLHDLDGILGLEVFGLATVTLDFPKRQLILGPPGLPVADDRSVFAYEGTLPVLPLDLEGQRTQAYLDTGNVRAGIILPASVADQLAGRDAARPAGVAHTINAARPMYRLALSGPARIGDVVLPVSEVDFPSVATIGIIGAAALRGLVVRIDTLNHRVQVQQGEAAAPS